MLFSQAKGRKVVDIQTAGAIATVTSCAVAPSPSRVTAFGLKARGHGNTLSWDNVESFGTDALIVGSADAIQAAKEIPGGEADQRHDPIGKRALTEAGQTLGTVRDIDFDETDGHIRRLVVAGGQEIPGERLLGVGSYAVVVAGR